MADEKADFEEALKRIVRVSREEVDAEEQKEPLERRRFTRPPKSG